MPYPLGQADSLRKQINAPQSNVFKANFLGYLLEAALHLFGVFGTPQLTCTCALWRAEVQESP